MSETTTKNPPESAEGPTEATEPEAMFNKADLSFFSSEDGHAGSVIGKMLALFFFYTVVVMALVAYSTLSVTN